MQQHGFRPGQWVLFGKEERIGILVHEDVFTDTGAKAKRWDVHLVKPDGTTDLVIPNVAHISIKPARREHIPASRLETASQAALEKYYPV